MRTAVPRELRSWGDEIGILFRRWWWVAALVLILSWLPPAPAVQVAFTAGCLAAVAFLGVWVAITVRRMPRRPDEKWKRDVSRNVLASWTAVAARVGLSVPGYGTNGAVVPAISTPVWNGWTCAVGVSLPQGLGREHLQAQADLLAQAFAARRATVHGEHIGALVLRLEYADALEHPFSLEVPAAWNGRSIPMGKDASGSLWSLRLGPHTLVRLIRKRQSVTRLGTAPGARRPDPPRSRRSLGDRPQGRNGAGARSRLTNTLRSRR